MQTHQSLGFSILLDPGSCWRGRNYKPRPWQQICLKLKSSFQFEKKRTNAGIFKPTKPDMQNTLLWADARTIIHRLTRMGNCSFGFFFPNSQKVQFNTVSHCVWFIKRNGQFWRITFQSGPTIKVTNII